MHDSRMCDKLVDESDEAVVAESAYQSEEAREHLLECDFEDII